MSYVAARGTAQVLIPTGQKLAVSYTGAGQAIVSYQAVGSPSYYEAGRVSGEAVFFGPFAADRMAQIESGPTEQAEYAVGVNPSLASSASPGQKSLRQVSGGTFVPNQLHGSNLFSYSRSPHYAMMDLAALQIVLPNWYVNASMAETNGGATGTWTASIEYPAGTFTQVKFDGNSIGSVAAGANLVSDSCSVAIPMGSKFWVRLWQNAPGRILWNNQYQGDGTAEFAAGTTAGACPDYTMGGSAAVATPIAGGMVTPCAIIAQSGRPAIGGVGDSIMAGKGDVADMSSLQGYSARAFGGRYAFLNVGVSSDTLQNFITSNAKRRALVNAYCTHVILEYGSNDVINGRTAAQILADTLTILGYFPGKKLAICTLTPRVTSTDSYVTVANQTVLASEPVRLVVNAQRRNGLVGASALGVVHAVFDIERACESSYLSGKWNVITGTVAPGTVALTDDGIHPNRMGHIEIAARLNTASFV